MAGGLGTRISEETHLKPKPMVEIGGRPILWHIIKNLSSQGVKEFIVCTGYKGYCIKEYFWNYLLHISDVRVNTGEKHRSLHHNPEDRDDWSALVIDTGESTLTGGRLKRVEEYLDERFIFTYGDGLADINIGELTRNHEESGKEVTVTAVKPPGRFGSLVISNDDEVERFQEKPEGDGSWINGGFFMVNKSSLRLIEGDDTVWEGGPLVKLAEEGSLGAYKHKGFWQAMDTLRDKTRLESIWSEGNAPWKNW